MRNELCENCSFWVKRTDEDGECHRWPPMLDSSGHKLKVNWPNDNLDFWIRPLSKKDDWCGEWKRA